MSQDSPASEVGRDRRGSWGTLRHMAASPRFACGRDGRPGGAASPPDPVAPRPGPGTPPPPRPAPPAPSRPSPPVPAPRALPVRAPRWGRRAPAATPAPGTPSAASAPGPRGAAYRGGRRSSAGLHATRRPTGRGGPGAAGRSGRQAGGRARSARHAGKRSSACRLRALAARAWTTLPRGPRARSPAPPRRLWSSNAGGGYRNTSSSPRPAARAGWPFEELLNSVTATVSVK